MFSRALFKQSMKANWVKWTVVTVATCVMLAIVIVVLGNLGINDIRDSLKQVFTQADQESYLKENSVDSYELYLTTTSTYNEVGGFGTYLSFVTGTYDGKVQDYRDTHEGAEPSDEQKQTFINETVEEIITLINSLPEAMRPDVDEATIRTLIPSVLNFYILNPTLSGVDLLDGYLLNEIYTQAYDREIAKEDMTPAEAADRAEQARTLASDAIAQYKADSEAGNITAGADFDVSYYESIAVNYVNEMMYDTVYDMQIEEGANDDEAKQYAVSVKVISNTAISTYTLWLAEYEEDNIDAGLDAAVTDEQKESARAEAIESITDQIPEKVGEALSELGNMDIYGLIIGSIFYRIAGLLLPMVFVIMVANGLLAGQVDSGSMAYVLSTPTKRRTVTVTQMTYLIIALLAMYLLLTAVSVVSVWAVGGNSFAINYSEILLFNLGAFLTMFAIAGFCFMCSAIFNRTKYSMSIGGGITIFSLVCTILGLFGSNVVPSAMRIDAMNFFNYLSVISLFDTVSILDGGLSYLWKLAILLGIGIVTFIIGVFRFDKKDLPL